MTTHSNSQSPIVKVNDQVSAGNDYIQGDTSIKISNSKDTYHINFNDTNNKVPNISEQEQDKIAHEKILLDYYLKSMEFIDKSWVRSECIDPECEVHLQDLRKSLDLLPAQTISIENEIKQIWALQYLIC